MRRDMNLIRDILLAIENDPRDEVPSLALEGHDLDALNGHIMLAREGGLLTADTVPASAGPVRKVVNLRLSWDGHEFLDNARSDQVWSEAKGRAERAVGSVSIGVMTQLLIAIAKDKLSLT